MATTASSDLIVPEVLEDAVAAGVRGMKVMMGTGAVMVREGFRPDRLEGGTKVKVPLFGHMGEFEDISESSALTLNKLTMTSEETTVIQSGKAYEQTQLAALAGAYADPEGEASRQIIEGAARRIEKEAVTKAPTVAGSQTYTDNDNIVSYDHFVETIAKFGDEERDLAAWVLHSKVRKDIRKIKDSTGRPIYTDPKDSADVPRILGVPVFTSDFAAQVFPTIVATGTTPPTVAVTGRRVLGLASDTIRIDIVAGGAVGTATFRYSFDQGTTWSSTVATAASVVLGTSGLTATFAAGTYNADNQYDGDPRYETLLVKKGAMIAWMMERPVVLQDVDVTKNNKILAVHMYFCVHPYSRLPNSTRSGVGLLQTK